MDFGVIQYSDLVTETTDSQSYSLMLSETSVVAVELLDQNVSFSGFYFEGFYKKLLIFSA